MKPEDYFSKIKLNTSEQQTGMLRAGKYAELAAAVHSLKGDLLQPNQMKRLVEAGELSETLALLTKGSATVEGDDVTAAESYLTLRVITLVRRLAAYTPDDCRPLIKLFLMGYELACVKEMLGAIINKVDLGEAVRQIVPAGRFTLERCKTLIEAHEPNRVIAALDNEGLKSFLAPRVGDFSSEATAAMAIDQYYYRKLWAMSDLPDTIDTRSARALIGKAVDHLNILSALRARLAGLDVKSTLDLLIPVDYRLGDALKQLAESTSIHNLIRIVERTEYAEAVHGITGVDGDLAKVERAFCRSHLKSCVNVFAGSPFNIGLALAFLFMKNYELRDLFTIINGKANNVASQRVLDALILPSM